MLYDEGLSLDFGHLVSESDKNFYRLVEAEQPDYKALEVSAGIMNLDPNAQIHVHGNRENLADVVDSLYSQVVSLHELKDEIAQPPKENFALRLLLPSVGVACLAILIPTAVIPAAIDAFDLPKIPYSIGAGILSAATVAGLFFYVERSFSEDKKRTAALKQLNEMGVKFLEEHDAFRVSLLRAGAVKGIFPQEYGLP